MTDRTFTTVAIANSERGLIDVAAQILRDEKNLVTVPNAKDTLVLVLREFLSLRGVETLEAKGTVPIPVVVGKKVIRAEPKSE